MVRFDQIASENLVTDDLGRATAQLGIGNQFVAFREERFSSCGCARNPNLRMPRKKIATPPHKFSN
jgi:hypothetical protein